MRETRVWGVKAKIVASVLAGSMCMFNVSGLAMAQNRGAPPPAAQPAGAAPATASPADRASAKKHYEAGFKLYTDGKYDEALKEFTAADAILPSVNAARFIGLCQDKLGHFPEAVAAYQRFLDAPPKGKEKEVKEAQDRVDQIKQIPGKLHVETTPPGAFIAIDGKPQPNPTPTDIDVPPGTHKLRLTADKYEPVEKDIAVGFASKVDVKETLAAKVEAPPPAPVAVTTTTTTTTPPPPPPPPPEPRSKLPAYITGGLAVAAAGVGTIFGIMALGDKSDYDKNPTSSKADDGENHALIADMAFFVAVTLGVTSAVLFLTKDDAPATTGSNGAPRIAKKKSTFTITPAPIITPTGGGAGAVVRF